MGKEIDLSGFIKISRQRGEMMLQDYIAFPTGDGELVLVPGQTGLAAATLVLGPTRAPGPGPGQSPCFPWMGRPNFGVWTDPKLDAVSHRER